MMRETRDRAAVRTELLELVGRYAHATLDSRGGLRRRIDRCLCELDVIIAVESIDKIDDREAYDRMSSEERMEYLRKLAERTHVCLASFARAFGLIGDQKPGATS